MSKESISICYDKISMKFGQDLLEIQYVEYMKVENSRRPPNIIVVQGLDDNDVNAVLRNRGDGLDDEECPEKVFFLMVIFLVYINHLENFICIGKK